jgi:hypothetical protein
LPNHNQSVSAVCVSHPANRLGERRRLLNPFPTVDPES